ncbi:uncharacterized protein BJ171DRAFT_443970 [Polychytrium aggregatum]|uniref:uncharacterized protein n=1 Tax=Polychytrium aggregatum TaxID=110093 RepID=UPI0022FEB5E4|nr:uncharacterized protein BJ171DRAFT_443970 [Polychytrium aggregatum]KAI9202790.1 hypothetical protein BJ171DRAFT_443970 [Polychytrium aggregatum]
MEIAFSDQQSIRPSFVLDSGQCVHLSDPHVSVQRHSGQSNPRQLGSADSSEPGSGPVVDGLYDDLLYISKDHSRPPVVVWTRSGIIKQTLTLDTPRSDPLPQPLASQAAIAFEPDLDLEQHHDFNRDQDGDQHQARDQENIARFHLSRRDDSSSARDSLSSSGASTAVQAAWVYFPADTSPAKDSHQDSSDSLIKALCVLFPEYLQIQYLCGRQYVTPLPFAMQRLWPLGCGVLLERKEAASGESLLGSSSLYILEHPLDSLRAVSISEQPYPILSLSAHRSAHHQDGGCADPMPTGSTWTGQPESTPSETMLRMSDSLASIVGQRIVHIYIDGPRHSGSGSKILLTSHSPTTMRYYIWSLVSSTAGPEEAVAPTFVHMSTAPSTTAAEKDNGSTAHNPKLDNQRCSNRASPATVLDRPSQFRLLCISCVTHSSVYSPSQLPFLTTTPVSGYYLWWIMNSQRQQLCCLPLSVDAPIHNSVDGSVPEFGARRSYRALTAVPVTATRLGDQDVLILQPDNTLALWCGLEDPIPCTMPRNFQRRASETFPSFVSTKRRRSSSTEDPPQATSQAASQAPNHGTGPLPETLRSPSKESRVCDLRLVLGNRVDVVLSDGNSVRIALQFCSEEPLVKQCIAALRTVLPARSLTPFLRRHLLCQHSLQYEEELSYGLTPWERFLIVLFSFLHGPAPTVTIVGDCANKHGSTASSQPFQELLNRQPVDFGCPEYECLNASADCRPSTTLSISSRLEYLYTISLRLKSRFYPLEPDITGDGPLILLTLHLVYEDLKLNTLREQARGHLGAALCVLAHRIQWKSYVDYYRRDGVFHSDVFKGSARPESLHQSLQILIHAAPNIFEWLSDSVAGKEVKPFLDLGQLSEVVQRNQDAAVSKIATGFYDPAEAVFSVLKSSLDCNLACAQTTRIVCFYKVISDPDFDRHPEALIAAMSLCRFQHADLLLLPEGVAIPLREALFRIRSTPPSEQITRTWPMEAFKLIGREDLAEQRATIKNLLKARCFSLKRSSNSASEGATHSKMDTSIVSRLRFMIDDRIKDVQDMLGVNPRPCEMDIHIDGEMSEHDIAIEQQSRLMILANRVLSLPFGRAALMFKSTPFHSNSQIKSLRPISISAKMPPVGSVVTLDLTQCLPDFLEGPEFHEGVADGLCVDANESELDGAWIAFNKPDDLDPHHAGFLFSMGLLGHLRNLVQWRGFHYLTPKHPSTVMAYLLGLGAAHVSTCEEQVARILSVHIPGLLPPSSLELQIAPINQAAATFSLGLVYMSSMHNVMAKSMLDEMQSHTRSDTDSADSCQENLALCAGFAFGMITLGHGSKIGGIDSGKAVQRLVAMLESSTSQETSLHGQVWYRRSYSGGNFATPERSSRSTAWLTSSVSPDVVAPAAAVALGLAFLKTNNRQIANRLAIPTSLYHLDFLPPDQIALRILCRNLILWSYIEPTERWIRSQIPESVKRGLFGKADSMDFTRVAIPKIALSKDDSLLYSYYGVIAGCCLSLGLRFAGTANQMACSVLLNYLDLFLDLGLPEDAGFRPQLQHCIALWCQDSVVISVGLVMAGTGNRALFQRFTRLHERLVPHVSFGSHVATHMAIGFLFLAGGTRTLGTSSKSVAALLASVFPRFPSSVTDQRAHLQALRYMWVLAVEDRCLVTRDVTTRELCCVPVSIKVYDQVHGGNVNTLSPDQRLVEMRMVTPCLLPPYEFIHSIRICGPRYWSWILELGAKRPVDSQKRIELVVKRKIGQLGYLQDPKGVESFIGQMFPRHHSFLIKESHQDFIQSFSADPQILAFAEYFCGLGSNDRAWQSNYSAPNPQRTRKFHASVLYECLAHDQPEMIQSFLEIYEGVRNLRRSTGLSNLWSAIIVLSFYERQSVKPKIQGLARSNSAAPVREHFARSLRHELESYFGHIFGSSSVRSLGTSLRSKALGARASCSISTPVPPPRDTDNAKPPSGATATQSHIEAPPPSRCALDALGDSLRAMIQSDFEEDLPVVSGYPSPRDLALYLTFARWPLKGDLEAIWSLLNQLKNGRAGSHLGISGHGSKELPRGLSTHPFERIALVILCKRYPQTPTSTLGQLVSLFVESEPGDDQDTLCQ